MIMGINQLLRIADYWKDDPFIGNMGIKQTMTRNCVKKFPNLYISLTRCELRRVVRMAMADCTRSERF